MTNAESSSNDAPVDVWVVVHADTDEDLFDHANADESLPFPNPVSFNGDDARAIVYITAEDTTIIDISLKTSQKHIGNLKH